MTTIAVTGGRSYGNAKRVAEALSKVHAATPITLLIHGAADGADTLAAQWAAREGISLDPQPADWGNLDAKPCRIKVGRNGPYNALAGFARNLKMLDLRPDLVVAFPGGPGTAHMTESALRRGIPVLEVDDE